MIRFVLRILICLALGAATTFAVAWTIVNLKRSFQSTRPEIGRIETRFGPGAITVRSVPGFIVESVSLFDYRVRSAGTAFTNRPKASPEMAARAERLLDRSGRPASMITVHEIGLPVPCISSLYTYDAPNRRSTWVDEWSLETSIIDEFGNTLTLRFPFRVSPLPFVLNTLIYAGVWLAFMSYAAWWRSRERRFTLASVAAFAMVAVIFGISITTAIAYLCASCTDTNRYRPSASASRPAHDPANATPLFPGLDEVAGLWLLRRFDAPGITRIDSEWTLVQGGSAVLQARPMADDVDTISRAPFGDSAAFLDPPADRVGMFRVERLRRSPSASRFAEDWPRRYVVAGGWPMLALWGGAIAGRADAAEPRLIHAVAFDAPLEDYDGTLTHTKIAPLAPLWPGLAIDVIFYGGLWSLLMIVLTGPRPWVRSLRRRRGRCAACGYDLRGNFADGCPECAWNRG